MPGFDSRDVELWDPQIEYTVELEYNPPAGVSPTLELRIYPVGSLSYSEMYIREVSWHHMANASFTNTLTHTYTGTVSGWTAALGATVTNGTLNNVVKITSTGGSSASVTVGVTAGELNVVRMDLNLFVEPSVEVEIQDATTNQILYKERIVNIGTGAHSLDFGIYPANANVIVIVRTAAATGLAGVEVDNLTVENPTPGKTNKYNENFGGGTIGAWTGTATLTYDGICGCLKTQTTANGQYAEVQVTTLTSNRQHYLGMDLNTVGHSVVQVDVYETTSGRILASRLLKGTNTNHRLTMTFSAQGTIRVRAKRITATGTVNLHIDNVQIGDHGHTLSSSGSLSMLNTVDFNDWSATGGTADFKVFLDGDQQMEIRDHSASYVSRTFTTMAGEAHELTFNLDRRGSVSGSVAVVVINPVTNGTITSQMVGSGGVTAVNLSFTPPGTSVELRLYSLNEYTLLDDIHLHWDRIVVHTICDNSRDYRYGFNTQEKTNEISGLGNHTTALFWEYDTRTGRRWNLDPKPNASESSYLTNKGNPIVYNDPNGDCPPGVVCGGRASLSFTLGTKGQSRINFAAGFGISRTSGPYMGAANLSLNLYSGGPGTAQASTGQSSFGGAITLGLSTTFGGGAGHGRPSDLNIFNSSTISGVTNTFMHSGTVGTNLTWNNTVGFNRAWAVAYKNEGFTVTLNEDFSPMKAGYGILGSGNDEGETGGGFLGYTFANGTSAYLGTEIFTGKPTDYPKKQSILYPGFVMQSDAQQRYNVGRSFLRIDNAPVLGNIRFDYSGQSQMWSQNLIHDALGIYRFRSTAVNSFQITH